MVLVRSIILAGALSLIPSFDGKRVHVDEGKELMLNLEAESPTQLTCCWFESGYEGDSAQKLCYVKGASCTNTPNYHHEAKLAQFESCSMLCTAKNDKVFVNLKDNKVFVNFDRAEGEQERARRVELSRRRAELAKEAREAAAAAAAGEEEAEGKATAKAEEASAAQKSAAKKAVAEKVAAEEDEADKAAVDKAEPENTAPEAAPTEAANEGAEAAPEAAVAAEAPKPEAAPSEEGATAPKPKATESSAIRALPLVALLATAAIAI